MEVRRFLNRLLGLPLREQNELFDLFCATLSGVISAARKDGKYDEGIADLSGASVSLEEPETALWSDPLTGAVMSTALVMVDRGVSWHAACEKLAARLALDGQQQPTTTTTTTTSAVAGAVVGGQRTPSSSARVPRSLVRAGSTRRPRDEDEDEDEDEGEGEDEGMSDFIVDDDAEEEEEYAARGSEEAGEDEEKQSEAEAAEEEAATAAAAEAAAAAVAPGDVELNVELEEISDDDDDDAHDDAQPRAGGAPATARRKPPSKGADHCTGFHRSRFLQAGERLYVLALPRANRAGLYLLTRPSTGDSPFEEEEVRCVGWRLSCRRLNLIPPFPSFPPSLIFQLDLRRKYEKISPEEVRSPLIASLIREDLAGGGAHQPVGVC